MTHALRKLPSWGTLHRLYVLQGLSYRQIGEQYGVAPKSVENRMRSDAQARGVEWPLKRGRPGWRRRKSELVRASKDSVTSTMIGAEIREACKRFGITQKQLGVRAGYTPATASHTLSRIASGARGRVSRETAGRIMAAIEQLEHEERRRQARANISAGVRRRNALAQKGEGVGNAPS